MPNSYVALGDQQKQEEVSHQFVRNCIGGRGKAIALLSMCIGLCLVVLWSGGGGLHPADQEPISAMAWTAMQPARSMQAALPWPGYKQQFRSTASPARTALDILQSYGIPSSPMERLAITSIDAFNRGTGMRDVVTMAMQDSKLQVQVSAMSTALKNKLDEMPGALPPLGFFDPWGLTVDIEEKTLVYYRESELKHGRVCMLAFLGILVGEKYHPLFGGDIDGLSYTALQATSLSYFWPAVVIACGIPEILANFAPNSPFKERGNFYLKPDYSPDKYTPGDYGFDPFGLKPKKPDDFTGIQSKEIANGRLAMIAVAGIIAQEYATGQKVF